METDPLGRGYLIALKGYCANPTSQVKKDEFLGKPNGLYYDRKVALLTLWETLGIIVVKKIRSNEDGEWIEITPFGWNQLIKLHSAQ